MLTLAIDTLALPHYFLFLEMEMSAILRAQIL
jgi:hypothetical protein